MAHTRQNIESRSVMSPQIKNRLMHKLEQDEIKCENNNTMLQDEIEGTINGDTVNRDIAVSDNNSDADFNLRKYEAVEFSPKIRWPDLLAQIFLHFVSVYGLYLVIFNKIYIYTTLFVLATIYTSGLGITAGVHRLWSHRAYKAKIPLRILLALLFTITGQRDIYRWALDHRVHHKYSDTVADPHNIQRGFWFSHVGWLVLTPHPAVENRRMAIGKTCYDLLEDPVVRWHKIFFIPLFIILNVGLPTWIPMHFWNESLWNSFVVSFVTRFTITLNMAYSVNSFAHMWGNKPYDKFIKPVENKMVSIAALGEGWHNYHHAFPWDYRTSELGRINVSTKFIDLFARLGWAYDLKAATPTMIQSRAKRSGDGSNTAHMEEEPYPDTK